MPSAAARESSRLSAPQALERPASRKPCSKPRERSRAWDRSKPEPASAIRAPKRDPEAHPPNSTCAVFPGRATITSCSMPPARSASPPRPTARSRLPTWRWSSSPPSRNAPRWPNRCCESSKLAACPTRSSSTKSTKPPARSSNCSKPSSLAARPRWSRVKSLSPKVTASPALSISLSTAPITIARARRRNSSRSRTR